MATVTARKVDDADYALLSREAASHGRSISEEVRLLIAERADMLRAEKLLADLRDIRDATKGLFGMSPDSVDLIRSVRDEG